MFLKKLGKSTLCRTLEWQVKRLRAKNSFKIITVAGSVGKTSTKLAIATLLSSRAKVIYQDGNYNDRLTVPLVLFSKTEPGIYNIWAWVKILLSNEQIIRTPYPYDLAVLEIGTDKPGELKRFKYLKPDLTVITAVQPEHMQHFKELDKVAKEEMLPVSYSISSLINLDDVDVKYRPKREYYSYGSGTEADYRIEQTTNHNIAGQTLKISLNKKTSLEADIPLLGRQGAKIVLAAVACAHIQGWTESDIQTGLNTIKPVAGRMNVLKGVSGSILIDDTYNSSPSAAKAALDVLYSLDGGSRIAILGDMNELGADSVSQHKAVGEYCDPNKLNMVITIGQQANNYLAPAAKAKGCNIKSFESPYAAGAYLKDQLKARDIVLAKGSQNGVFAEEAVQILLSQPSDASKLVRQSSYWQKLKKRQFTDAL